MQEVTMSDVAPDEIVHLCVCENPVFLGDEALEEGGILLHRKCLEKIQYSANFRNERYEITPYKSGRSPRLFYIPRR